MEQGRFFQMGRMGSPWHNRQLGGGQSLPQHIDLRPTVRAVSFPQTISDGMVRPIRTLCPSQCAMASSPASAASRLARDLISATRPNCIPTESGTEAIRMFAELEAILLDPVYSAKGAADLIDLIRNGHFKKSERLVFLHTGGAVALFGYDLVFDFSDRWSWLAVKIAGSHAIRMPSYGVKITPGDQLEAHPSTDWLLL